MKDIIANKIWLILMKPVFGRSVAGRELRASQVLKKLGLSTD